MACPSDAPIVIAPIFETDLHASDATIHVPAGEEAGIELEFAFRLLRPLPDPASLDFAEKLRDAVELLPAIEIVRSRLSEPALAGAELKMADNQMNGALILGEPIVDWGAISVERASGFLSAGDSVLLDGQAPVPGGNAFETLRRFALAVGSHCGGLLPGHVVITGSLNGLPWMQPGLEVHGKIDGLGEVGFRIVRA